MPMPWSVTLISTAPSRRADGDGDAGALRAVVHGVLDEVADGGDELRLAAAHGQPALAAAHDLDAAGRGGRAGAVDGLGDHLVDRHEVLLGQRVGALQPREVDELLHQPGQPAGLVLQPAGEAAHRGRVLARVEQRLGEQRHRADRRLELVADVGDEVAAHRLDAAGLGDVLDEQGDVALGVADRRDPHAHGLGQPHQPAAGRLDLDLLRLPAAPHVARPAGAARRPAAGCRARPRARRPSGWPARRCRRRRAPRPRRAARR